MLPKNCCCCLAVQEGKYTIQQSSHGRFIGGEEKDAETSLWAWEQQDREKERQKEPVFYRGIVHVHKENSAEQCLDDVFCEEP